MSTKQHTLFELAKSAVICNCRIAFFSLLFLCLMCFTPGQVVANNTESYISFVPANSVFTLSSSNYSAPLCVDSEDYPGVIRVLKLLQNDLEKVTGIQPQLITKELPDVSEVVIVGTLGRSKLIEKLVNENKISVEDIEGKWETFLIQTVENPFEGVSKALVIVGSDKRGTIFGMFDLAEKIGVSPWYWWADVPVKKHNELFVLPGRYTMGEPKVKYRGIFINDEAPALTGWAAEKFGTEMFNHRFYEHVFELILRLKGNFLWPAMWGKAFYDDDQLNPKLADEYGVVIGTSHHEPMMRAHDEWRRYGSGPWNYEKNQSNLKEFWKKGIERMGSNESIVTLAMRGDGDEAMSSTANVSLLQKIVDDQRKILTEVTGKTITSIPQVWALYKEVQEYYDMGMRVPDDVTLLLCDDNWGNVRKLPKLNDKPRAGGYGMYYHYDFVGGPRNYKWLNTNQIERVWQQMHLAYEYGVKEIWIVNVGDIKPMEFPIEFFLDYAWNPEEISAASLPEHYKDWVREQFGSKHKNDIADILERYTKFNSRRKPELLEPDTYSLVNYREAEKIVHDYKTLEEKAEKIYNDIPEEYKDAFYQLVLHPVQACSNLNELLVTIGRNRLYAKQGRSLTNSLAEKAKELFERDAEITLYYNQVMADGKWNHMMDQTHIGYTSWQQPDKNIMPDVREIKLPEEADMGVAIEGAEEPVNAGTTDAVLPEFDSFNKQSYYIEIFNRGDEPFDFTIKADEQWILLNPSDGQITTEERVWVSVDWDKAPKGTTRVPITITGANNKATIVNAVIHNSELQISDVKSYFIESNNCVVVESGNYTKAVDNEQITWLKIPNLGRTKSAMTIMPVTAGSITPGANSPRLEYNIHLFSDGEITVNAYFSPTLNFGYTEGLRYAVSIDDEKPQVININKGDTPDWKYPQYWNQQVSDNIRKVSTKHSVGNPGKHVLKFWAVDSNVVLQKIVVETGEVKPSYLGPPESYNSSKAD